MGEKCGAMVQTAQEQYAQTNIVPDAAAIYIDLPRMRRVPFAWICVNTINFYSRRKGQEGLHAHVLRRDFCAVSGMKLISALDVAAANTNFTPTWAIPSWYMFQADYIRSATNCRFARCGFCISLASNIGQIVFVVLMAAQALAFG